VISPKAALKKVVEEKLSQSTVVRFRVDYVPALSVKRKPQPKKATQRTRRKRTDLQS
jgi:hypothetical protein